MVGIVSQYNVKPWCETCGKDAPVLVNRDCLECYLWWERAYREDKETFPSYTPPAFTVHLGEAA